MPTAGWSKGRRSSCSIAIRRPRVRRCWHGPDGLGGSSPIAGDVHLIAAGARHVCCVGAAGRIQPQLHVGQVPAIEELRPVRAASDGTIEQAADDPAPNRPVVAASASRAHDRELDRHQAGLHPGRRIPDGFAGQRFDAFDDEKPQHTVRITKPFYLGVTEVTQEQYERVMGTNPSNFKGAQLPVEMSRGKTRSSSAASFRSCRPSGVLAGCIACRPKPSGNTRAVPAARRSGRSETPNRRWVTTPGTIATRVARRIRWPRRSRTRGACTTCTATCTNGVRTGKRDYASTTVSDPTGPATGSYRVFRGGGWSSGAGYCRSAHRLRYAPDSRGGYLGFRLAFSSVDQSGR
jgi:hypothetical protein